MNINPQQGKMPELNKVPRTNLFSQYDRKV